MTGSPKANDDKVKQPRSAAILLSLTILDTTVRMFVPTIGGTFVGIALDHIFNTVPVFTAVMIIVGFSVSILLVVTQLKGFKKK
ncbi:MAG: AtpZ/AtpI family protein [Candidatus Saccharibacteria bacterium]